MFNVGFERMLKGKKEFMYFAEGLPKRDIIKMYTLMINRLSKSYYRERNSMLDLVSNAGGLASVLLDFVAPIIIMALIKPFTDLDMAFNFAKMRVMDGLASQREKLQTINFEQALSPGFYLYYFMSY